MGPWLLWLEKGLVWGGPRPSKMVWSFGLLRSAVHAADDFLQKGELIIWRLTPWKIIIFEPQYGGLVEIQMIFLFNCVIFRFQPLIFGTYRIITYQISSQKNTSLWTFGLPLLYMKCEKKGKDMVKTPPRKITWQWKITIFLGATSNLWFFQCHVSFWGCRTLNHVKYTVDGSTRGSPMGWMHQPWS